MRPYLLTFTRPAQPLCADARGHPGDKKRKKNGGDEDDKAEGERHAHKLQLRSEKGTTNPQQVTRAADPEALRES